MLAQLQTVKDRLKLEDNVDDVFVTLLIKLASGLFDQYCNRTFAWTDGAIDEFQGDAIEVPVRCYPIEYITGFDLQSDSRRSWLPQRNYDFVIRNNCVITLTNQLGTSKEQARVIYTGGYVLPGTDPSDGQTALPDAIQQLCVEQVVWLYQNKDRLGITGMAGEGGSFQSFAASGGFGDAKLDLLPLVKFGLRDYRRFVL